MSEEVDDKRGRRLGIAILVGAAAGVLLLVAFADKRRVPPLTPRDEAHATSFGIRTAESCLGCHARNTPLDRGPNHTGRQDCWGCHSLSDR
jgi:hypothetical protein